MLAKIFLILSAVILAAGCANKEKRENTGLIDSENFRSRPLESVAERLGEATLLTSLAQKIQFDGGSAKINSTTENALDQIAEELVSEIDGYRKVRITGFSDSQGNSRTNKILARTRAENVRQYLIQKGVPAHKLEAIGGGVADTNSRPTASEMAEDRGVDLKIVR